MCLLVITIEEAVARWAQRSIELGPGACCKPWVIGPANTPAVTELSTAKENVELAVLSVVEHAQSTDTSLVESIVSAAILASADIDAERSSLYFDLILISRFANAPEGLEASMNSLGFEYQSAFARRYFYQGKAEGRAELILKQLTLRFGPLPEAAHARLLNMQDAQLDAVAERVLTARTLDEALGTSLAAS